MRKIHKINYAVIMLNIAFLASSFILQGNGTETEAKD